MSDICHFEIYGLTYTLVLRVVLGVSFVVVVVLLVDLAITLVVRHIVVTLDKSLPLTLTTAQFTVLSFLAIGKHNHILFEFSVFLDCLQQLAQEKRGKVSVTRAAAVLLTLFKAISNLGKTFS